MSRQISGLGRWGIVLGLATTLVGVASVVSADGQPGKVLLVSHQQQVTPKKKTAKKGSTPTKKGDDSMMGEGMAMPAGKGAAAITTPAASNGLSFKKDIAPIIVANCLGCHSGTGAGVRNGKYDMTTFEKLMAGGKRGKDIIPGNPDESHFVQMTKGEEIPVMPPRNGQRGFADEAAAKLEAWVAAGAILDAGLAATDPLSKYASTVDDLRKAELDKMTPEERQKIAETAGRERWKKATKIEPEVASTAHFLLLSNLPKPRADKLLKTMEEKYIQTQKLLSTGKNTVFSPTEKIGIYVFKDTLPFVEFVRTNENQEVEPGEQARTKLNVASPYIVAVDPAAGGEEATQAAPRKGAKKAKKAEEPTGGPERTLAGALTEQLVIGAANQAGKPPRWVSLGLGAFMASQVEPGSPYYRRLRAETLENMRIGWQPKANEALGGEAKVETTRAIGYSLFEWMAANGNASTIANFVHIMLEGQGKLDDAIGSCLDMNRDGFLTFSQEWIMSRYGRN